MLKAKQTNTHQNVHWAAQLWNQPKYNTYFQSCYGISEEHFIAKFGMSIARISFLYDIITEHNHYQHNHTDLSVALHRVTYLFFNKMCEFPCGPRDFRSGQSNKCSVLNLSYTVP